MLKPNKVIGYVLIPVIVSGGKEKGEELVRYGIARENTYGTSNMVVPAYILTHSNYSKLYITSQGAS